VTTTFRPPALDKAAPIVNVSDGRITPYFQRFWQNLTFTASDNPYVAVATFTTWSAATGTAERTTFATYTSPTISNPPTTGEVQAIADHLQILSRRMKALIDDLKS
jgi:hypothetical protein